MFWDWIVPRKKEDPNWKFHKQTHPGIVNGIAGVRFFVQKMEKEDASDDPVDLERMILKI